MDKLEELLPGIEEFLCQDLAGEKLSEETENKRLYYIERLDILKLPPSVPPRLKVPVFGVPPSPSPVKPIIEAKSPTLSQAEFTFEDHENDFAAHQREISRSFIAPEEIEALEEKEVKVYDDIDLDHPDAASPKDNNESKNSDDTNLYEIPVPKNTSPNRSSQADSSGYEETKSPVKDDYSTADQIQRESTEFQPPPLPPRRERSSSDAQVLVTVDIENLDPPPKPDPPVRQSSIQAVRPPDLPARPNLPTKSELYSMAEKGHERSEGSVDLTDDAELTSYESCNEDEQAKLNIKLPKPIKKHKKPSKSKVSRSSKEWDVTIPFQCLEDVTLSGEVQYKGKLSWTRKLAALTEGRMVCYKPEKTESKPALVIQLTGYEASCMEKENRRGFDVRLLHPSLETHMFSVDFKEWAQMWVEYMNAMSHGKPPPGQYQHLAKSATLNGVDASKVYGSKGDLRKSVSNVSSESSNDNSEAEYSSMKRKSRKERHRVTRMGSIASRASSFFESLGKKNGKKVAATIHSSNSLGNLAETGSESQSRVDISDHVAVKNTLSLNQCNSIENLDCDKIIQYQGYLNIFSSFNKRKWGKRWCVVKENVFECYKNEKSTVCELDFPLHPCILQRAVSETKSEMGLMLLHNKTEKITIEPLNKEEMAGWLRVLMKETNTDVLPDGLEEFWVEDESPYHDIRLEDISSPLSDVFPYDIVKEMNTVPENVENIEVDSDINKNALDNSTLSDQCEDPDDSANDSMLSNPRVPGELTGELYTQVQRSSNGFMQTASDNKPQSNESIFSSSVVQTKFGRTMSFQTSQYSKSVFGNTTVTTKTFSHSFSDSFLGANESSLFDEILTKINENRSNNVSFYDHDDEDQNVTDTAYNSGTCSENSSLERKNRAEQDSYNDGESSSLVFGSSQNNNSEDDENHELLSDIRNSNIEELNNNFQNNSTTTDLNSHVTINSNTNILMNSNHYTSTDSWTSIDQTKSSSREQCDSAIFESDSILDDLTCASPESLMRKIEQLRTHLVELKKNRICVRDRKLCCEVGLQEQLEQEYSQLDDECRTVTEEIQVLERKLQI